MCGIPEDPTTVDHLVHAFSTRMPLSTTMPLTLETRACLTLQFFLSVFHQRLVSIIVTIYLANMYIDCSTPPLPLSKDNELLTEMVLPRNYFGSI